MALGKVGFAGTIYGECYSPSVALGELFAECFRWFAECFGHSANSSSPVVWRLILRGGGCEAEKQCDGSIGGLVPCSRSADEYIWRSCVVWRLLRLVGVRIM